jgi:hypothetical protein
LCHPEQSEGSQDLEKARFFQESQRVDLGQGKYFGILEQWIYGRMGNSE